MFRVIPNFVTVNAYTQPSLNSGYEFNTLGSGGFLRRTAYALSRVVLTKTDSGGTSFNFYEIVGNGSWFIQPLLPAGGAWVEQNGSELCDADGIWRSQ
jgi:hypothetical protein